MTVTVENSALNTEGIKSKEDVTIQWETDGNSDDERMADGNKAVNDSAFAPAGLQEEPVSKAKPSRSEKEAQKTMLKPDWKASLVSAQ